MVKATYVGTKAAVSTAAKTFARVTFTRRGYAVFNIECFGIDPIARKVIVEVLRGATGGTPGSAITGAKADTSHETPADFFTVNDVFTNESAYAAGSNNVLDRPTIHPQYHRQTVVVYGIEGETVDIRLTQDTGGAGVDAQVTTRVSSAA